MKTVLGMEHLYQIEAEVEIAGRMRIDNPLDNRPGRIPPPAARRIASRCTTGAAASRRWGQCVGVWEPACLAAAKRWCCHRTGWATNAAYMCLPSWLITFGEHEREDTPTGVRWKTWLDHEPRQPLPPLRLLLIWDNLAGHLSRSIVRWLFQHGGLPVRESASVGSQGGQRRTGVLRQGGRQEPV